MRTVWKSGGREFALDSLCSISHNTPVIPFRVVFQPGASLYEQVVYAAKKALISGQLRPGDAFPSVRTLSTALRINPNTAHKVITQLLNEGLLEVMPGTGTVVAQPFTASPAERSRLLDREVEQLAVEAKRLGLGLDEVTAALAGHWERLDRREGRPAGSSSIRGARTAHAGIPPSIAKSVQSHTWLDNPPDSRDGALAASMDRITTVHEPSAGRENG